MVTIFVSIWIYMVSFVRWYFFERSNPMLFRAAKHRISPWYRWKNGVLFTEISFIQFELVFHVRKHANSYVINSNMIFYSTWQNIHIHDENNIKTGIDNYVYRVPQYCNENWRICACCSQQPDFLLLRKKKGKIA